MRIAAIAALATLMTGCAAPGEIGAGPSVTGNQAGGKVPYAEGQMSAAMNASQAHCAQFGKKAQITQMVPSSDGGMIGFECR